MMKYIIPLIAKRININGRVSYQRPVSGFRKKLFDYLTSFTFRKKHRNQPGFPFAKLKDILDDIIIHYESENHAFVAKMYSNEWNGIEIMHPSINFGKFPNRTKKFGFSICFTFDYSFEQLKKQHEKFLDANFENVEFFLHDNTVRCYDLNCGVDKDKVFNILKKFYEEILGCDQDTRYYLDMSSYGVVT